MSDRVASFEATLDLIEEGVVVLDENSNILFWNKAAASITGHSAEEMTQRLCPANLYVVNEEHRNRAGASAKERRLGSPNTAALGYGGAIAGYTSQPLPATSDEIEEAHEASQKILTLVSMSHKLGHSVPAMLRKCALRDFLGVAIGTALFFYPVEEVDALPHGETSDDVGIERTQAEMEDRLDAAYHQWTTTGMPFGLMWLMVDQAQSLRTTHGRDACESMLRTVEQTLLRQMSPSETIGRWGNNEYLVLSHERTAELLLEHARRLVGQARTSDFRWWGDRVGITISVGVCQAAEGDSLQSLLGRARQAMQSSGYAGGNCVTEARSA
jgi:diguanylate cyclase (GGDEF)-like protein